MDTDSDFPQVQFVTSASSGEEWDDLGPEPEPEPLVAPAIERPGFGEFANVPGGIHLQPPTETQRRARVEERPAIALRPAVALLTTQRRARVEEEDRLLTDAVMLAEALAQSRQTAGMPTRRQTDEEIQRRQAEHLSLPPAIIANRAAAERMRENREQREATERYEAARLANTDEHQPMRSDNRPRARESRSAPSGRREQMVSGYMQSRDAGGRSTGRHNRRSPGGYRGRGFMRSTCASRARQGISG